MQDDIVAYVWRQGLVRQSVEHLLPEMPRWEQFLRGHGVTEIPRRGRPWSPARSFAENLLNLLIRQSAIDRDPALEHQLRNLTGVRPYKP
jgi:hypothetical protein